MFEKLLSLLLHAKGGAVATVLVLGASGALVTATVENGMTTVTITQPSATTTGTTTTTNTTVTETILALFNRTNADEDPTAPATAGNGCSDEAHARNEQMKRVNDASKTHRQEISALGKDAEKTSENKKLVKDADTAIKDIRQAAVKAIHATFDCDKDNDEDEDEDQDEDNDDEDEDSTAGTTSTTTAPSAFSGDDAKAIADLAISAMDLEVTKLKAKLTAATTTNTTNAADKAKTDSKSGKTDNKGKGNGKGRSGGND